MKKILFIANQIAGVQSLYPVYEQLKGKYRIDIYVSSLYLDSFPDKSVDVNDLAEAIVEDYPLIVFMGIQKLENSGNFRGDCFRYCRSVGVIDSPVNYSERFHNANNEFDMFHIPEFLIVPDIQAKNDLLEELENILSYKIEFLEQKNNSVRKRYPDAEHLAISKGNLSREFAVIPSGNPFHDSMTEIEYNPKEFDDLNRRILFYSQPETTTLKNFSWYKKDLIVDAMLEYSSAKHIPVDIKLHPRETVDDYKKYLLNDSVTIIEKLDFKESIKYSAVLGSATFALIESKLHGGRVISCLFNDNDNDYLNFRKFNIPICKDKEQLCMKLDGYVLNDVSIGEPLENFTVGATKCLSDLIEGIMEEKL